MNLTCNNKDSYYYRQLATAYKDDLPKGTTGEHIQNAVSACSGAIGLGLGFSLVNLMFSRGKASASLLARKFSLPKSPFFLPVGSFISFAIASATEKGTNNILQSESIQKKIRKRLNITAFDSLTLDRLGLKEPVRIGVADYKKYQDYQTYEVIFGTHFSTLSKDPIYLQKKGQMLERVEKNCKGIISKAILEKLNEDNQPKHGLCLGYAMNWMRYLFQNGMESVHTRDYCNLDEQGSLINKIIFQKINHITSSLPTSSIPQVLSSMLNIPLEKIHYTPRSLGLTEEPIYSFLKQHEGKIVCIVCSKKGGGHAICTGTLPKKGLYFMTSNSHVYFFTDLESLCRGILGVQKELFENTNLSYLMVVDPS
ncbi:MAG: hypothetical protein V4489_03215 [Chlamydiota bacterium]